MLFIVHGVGMGAGVAAFVTPVISSFSAVAIGAGMRGGGLKVVWTGLSETKLAAAWDGGAMYPNKSVYIEGTHGTTVIEGSNDEASYQTLTDKQGGDISFIADGIRKIEENTRQIKPRVSAGTGVSVNITIIASRGRG